MVAGWRHYKGDRVFFVRGVTSTFSKTSLAAHRKLANVGDRQTFGGRVHQRYLMTHSLRVWERQTHKNSKWEFRIESKYSSSCSIASDWLVIGKSQTGVPYIRSPYLMGWYRGGHSRLSNRQVGLKGYEM